MSFAIQPSGPPTRPGPLDQAKHPARLGAEAATALRLPVLGGVLALCASYRTQRFSRHAHEEYALGRSMTAALPLSFASLARFVLASLVLVPLVVAVEGRFPWVSRRAFYVLLAQAACVPLPSRPACSRGLGSPEPPRPGSRRRPRRPWSRCLGPCASRNARAVWPWPASAASRPDWRSSGSSPAGRQSVQPPYGATPWCFSPCASRRSFCSWACAALWCGETIGLREMAGCAGVLAGMLCLAGGARKKAGAAGKELP